MKRERREGEGRGGVGGGMDRESRKMKGEGHPGEGNALGLYNTDINISFSGLKCHTVRTSPGLMVLPHRQSLLHNPY